MKKLQLFLTVSTILFLATACSTKKEETAVATEQEVAAEEWPEMDAYHMVMAEVFHPYKDYASELVKSAESWANAPLPEKVNNDEVKTKLQDLKTSSEALAQLTTTGTNEEIGASLTSLHDKFHVLQEAWYGGGEHKHDH